MLNNLSKQYLGQNYSSVKTNTGKIELKDMDMVSWSFWVTYQPEFLFLRSNPQLSYIIEPVKCWLGNINKCNEILILCMY